MSRQHDILELERSMKDARSEKERRLIRYTISELKNESGSIRSMREKLIKAHRESDVEEIKDIHEYIKNKRQYQHELPQSH